MIDVDFNDAGVDTIVNLNSVLIGELNQELVLDVLKKIHKEAHYLAHKRFSEWDEYDLSNFRSLTRKASLL